MLKHTIEKNPKENCIYMQNWRFWFCKIAKLNSEIAMWDTQLYGT